MFPLAWKRKMWFNCFYHVINIKKEEEKKGGEAVPSKPVVYQIVNGNHKKFLGNENLRSQKEVAQLPW